MYASLRGRVWALACFQGLSCHTIAQGRVVDVVGMAPVLAALTNTWGLESIIISARGIAFDACYKKYIIAIKIRAGRLYIQLCELHGKHEGAILLYLSLSKIQAQGGTRQQLLTDPIKLGRAKRQ